jgi:hypothetical protein
MTRRAGRTRGLPRSRGFSIKDAGGQETKIRAAFLNWSRDGQYVYFLRWLENPAVMRIRITDRKVEQVSDLTNLPTTDNLGPWMGLDSDDS